MSPKQVKQLTDRREAWWKAPLNEGLRESVWEPALADITPDIAVEAMKRFARKQRNGAPPSLEDLLKYAEEIEEEQRRAKTAARRAEEQQKATDAWQRAWAQDRLPQRTQEPSDVIGQTLEFMARDAYALAHVEMNDKHLNRPGHEAEAIAFCKAKALEQPEEQERWIREVRLYEREQLKRLMTPEPGQRYVPLMTGKPVIEELVGARGPGNEREPGDDDE
jgi:hypothetical protein